MKLLGRGVTRNESLRWEGRSAEGKGKRVHVPGHLLVVGSDRRAGEQSPHEDAVGSGQRGPLQEQSLLPHSLSFS